MDKKCVIVGAGDFSASDMPEINGCDLLIAADGGYENLLKCGHTPGVFIGDLDSLDEKPDGIETLILPKIKDDTDTMAAVKLGLKRGYTEFVILGGLGGKRFSHTIANLQTLAFLKKNNACGTLISGKTEVRYLTPVDKAEFTHGSGFFSVFAANGKAVLDISGAKYSKQGVEVTGDFPLGVSNEFLPGTTVIKVLSGEIYLIIEK